MTKPECYAARECDALAGTSAPGGYAPAAAIRYPRRKDAARVRSCREERLKLAVEGGLKRLVRGANGADNIAAAPTTAAFAVGTLDPITIATVTIATVTATAASPVHPSLSAEPQSALEACK